MASKSASAEGTAAIASAAVYIDLPNRRYLLTSVVALTSKQHLTLVSVENARRIVSDAMASNVGVANAIASRFGTFDGGTSSAKVPVQATPERVGNLLARHRLLLIDLGPPVARVDTIVEGPRRDEIAQLPMSDKVMRVVAAMTELPASDWADAFGDAGVEALESLKEPQTLATLAFVFAIWAFAQTNPAGWAMDAALIGIAVVSLGLGIFGWIRQLRACLEQIAAIRTPEEEKQAAKALLKVLGQLGIDVLITLLTRAAGKAVKARSSGVQNNDGPTVSNQDSPSFNRARPRPTKKSTASETIELGAWRRVNEAMSDRAAAYQAQITGRAGESYIIDGVKFDGFSAGTLVDAKGPGYANFVKDGEFRSFFRGQESLLAQAQRQVAASKGAPITWHVAEAPAAEAMQAMLRANRVKGITIVHTPVGP